MEYVVYHVTVALSESDSLFSITTDR